MRSRCKAILVVMAMILALTQSSSSQSFRPPVKSTAELTAEQRLQLAVSALGQQLTCGVIHQDVLAGVTSQHAPAPKIIRPPWTSAIPRPIPSGEYTGMSQGTPTFSGKTARVPVVHHFRQPLNEPPWERVSTIADTLTFVDEASGWTLAATALNGDSPVWELAKRTNAAGGRGATGLTASVGSVTDFQNLFSDSLLLLKSVHSSADVVNSLSSNRLFGTDIIGVPGGVCATSFYSYTQGDHDFLGVTDFSWSRIVGADGKENWISTAGSPGSGPLQFSMPMGLCGFGNGFLIADAMNNRVVQVSITITGIHATGLKDTCYFTGCFNYPTDVDWRDTVQGDPHGAIVIADNGNGRLVQMRGSVACSNADFIGSQGYGPEQFMHPMSVCYGRNSTDHRQNRAIFVADRGNRRVTRVDWCTQPTAHWCFQSCSLPDADLVAVDVDNFGQVYALDAAQGILYKFSEYLTPIAAYRFPVSDGHTFYPHDFAIAHGIIWDRPSYSYVPMVLGDAFVVQNYTGTTGVHRYALGVAVLNDSAKYIFRTPTDTDYVKIDYTLTDYASVTISLRRNGVLRYQSGPIAHASGQQATEYWYPTDADSSGSYILEIRATSLYSNSNTHTVSIPLTVNRSYVNHGAYIISGPRVNCNSCKYLQVGHPFGYTMIVDAIDPDGDPLRYGWKCTGGVFEGGVDTVTTDSNRVRYYFFGAGEASKGNPPSETEVPLPYVRVTVSDNNHPPVSHLTSFQPCANSCEGCCCRCCCPHQGDVNDDGFVDVFDLIGAVSIVFSGAPDIQDPNCPTTRGDVNNDSRVDVFDVTRFVDIAFSGEIAINPCTQ